MGISIILSDLREEIKLVQDNVATYAGSQNFTQMDNKLKANLANLETNIMDIKQSKYTRDVQDYKMNVVYTWSKSDIKNVTPKFILKKPGYVNHSNRQCRSYMQTVNFSSTEADSCDTMSEV